MRRKATAIQTGGSSAVGFQPRLISRQTVLKLAFVVAIVTSVIVAVPDADAANAVTWGSHNTPSSMSVSAVVPVKVNLTNSGTTLWQSGGANPVRLSYHWRNGSCPGSSIAVWDGSRGILPSNVPVGGSVNDVGVDVRAPSTPGAYCLVYDMVQEGIAWFSNAGGSTLSVTVDVTVAQYGVTWGSHNTPTSMSANGLSNVTVSFTNIGTMAWPSGGANPVRLSYHWRNGSCPGSATAVWDGKRAALMGNVAAGGSVNNLAIGVQAPNSPGTYCLVYDLVHEGVTWFSNAGAATRAVTVNVSGGSSAYAVAWGAHNTPSSVAAGASVNINVTFTNTGLGSWAAGGANPVRLSYHWRNGTCPGSAIAVWDGRRANLTSNVPSGGTVTSLAINVLAPSAGGTYCLVYDLVEEGETWFSSQGAQTLNRTMSITGGGSPSPTATSSPSPTSTPSPTTTPGGTPPSGITWAFEETFDGSPGSPSPFTSSRLDSIVGENNSDGIITGFNFEDASDDGIIQAGHGSGCQAPPSTHNIVPNDDPVGFQTQTRPHLMFKCRDHMMTVMKSGYGIISFMPRQLFDWNGRKGTIEIDTNIYAFGREWWDFYIVPEDEMLLEIATRDEGATSEGLPKRGVKFSMLAFAPHIQVIDDYQVIHEAGLPGFSSAFASDPARTDSSIRRTFRLEMSRTTWKVSIRKADGTFYTASGNFPQQLSFTRGLIRVEHHAYNPRKDGIDDPYFTYHWDNFRFDGPVLPSRLTFEAAPHFIDMRHADPGDVSSPITINVSSTSQARLIGHMHTDVFLDHPEKISNSEHWAQVRVNNGAWVDVKFRKNVEYNDNRGWTTIDTPLSGLVNGANTIQFRYNVRPSGLTWQADGFRIKDLEIQVSGQHPVAFQAVESGSKFLSATLNPFLCEPGDAGTAYFGQWAMRPTSEPILERSTGFAVKRVSPSKFSWATAYLSYLKWPL